jgi:hypothetical protein
VFVCKVYAEVLGEFITKTKGYVMLCDGWKAYQVKKGDIKIAKGGSKIWNSVGIRNVFNPTPYRRPSEVVSCPKGELLRWFELTTQTYNPLVLPLEFSISLCVLPVYQSEVHTYLEVIHMLYTNTKSKL